MRMVNCSTSAPNSMLSHLYVPIEDVEKLERYSAGGYQPLARDEKAKQFVAVKVCTPDANPHELNILAHLSALRQNSSVSLGRGNAFKIDGPNGTHSCYVTAPARLGLSDAKDASVLAAQLVVAVEYLHSQGYAHDDFHHGNVLTRMPSGFSYSQCGQPELIPITRFKGKDLSPDISSHAIVPVWLGKANTVKFESRPPLVYRAPEARFESGTTPLSYPSDIWSPLFEGFLAREDDITCEHVDALGSLPPEWWSKWKVRQTRFNEDGKPLDWRSYRSWEGRSMLSFRPESRSLAREVFASEWMVEWALPECEKGMEASIYTGPLSTTLQPPPVSRNS
ncbi:hypothetical protein BDW68DRAFT_187770 [Aspergillus falconensis]